MMWQESAPEFVRVCNACYENSECNEQAGGQCVELPGGGCDYSAFVCLYPGDPCFNDGQECQGQCINREGRAVCASEEELEAAAQPDYSIDGESGEDDEEDDD